MLDRVNASLMGRQINRFPQGDFFFCLLDSLLVVYFVSFLLFQAGFTG
jgi:hypothetical protein